MCQKTKSGVHRVELEIQKGNGAWFQSCFIETTPTFIQKMVTKTIIGICDVCHNDKLDIIDLILDILEGKNKIEISEMLVCQNHYNRIKAIVNLTNPIVIQRG